MSPSSRRGTHRDRRRLLLSRANESVIEDALFFGAELSEHAPEERAPALDDYLVANRVDSR